MKLIKRTGALLVLMFGLVALGSASANTVDLRFTGFANGHHSGTIYDSTGGLVGGRTSVGVNAGLFRFDVLGSTGDFAWGSQVEAFCVQTGIALNQTGTVTYSLVSASDYFSSMTLGAIEGLYGSNSDSLGARTGDVAFQLALWEIINETGGSASLTSGSFQTDTFNGARNLAQSWLNDLGDFVGQFSMYVLTASGSQDLLVITPEPIVGVPEPGTLALLGIGLLALAAATMRRRRAGGIAA